MAQVKTAISIPKGIFEQVDALAARLNVSRSQLISTALEQYLRQYENRQIREKIDRVYSEAPDPDEANALAHIQLLHRRLLEPEEWK